MCSYRKNRERLRFKPNLQLNIFYYKYDLARSNIYSFACYATSYTRVLFMPVFIRETLTTCFSDE